MAMFTEKGQGPLDSEAGLSIIGTGCAWWATSPPTAS